MGDVSKGLICHDMGDVSKGLICHDMGDVSKGLICHDMGDVSKGKQVRNRILIRLCLYGIPFYARLS